MDCKYSQYIGTCVYIDASSRPATTVASYNICKYHRLTRLHNTTAAAVVGGYKHCTIIYNIVVSLCSIKWYVYLCVITMSTPIKIYNKIVLCYMGTTSRRPHEYSARGPPRGISIIIICVVFSVDVLKFYSFYTFTIIYTYNSKSLNSAQCAYIQLRRPDVYTHTYIYIYVYIKQ